MNVDPEAQPYVSIPDACFVQLSATISFLDILMCCFAFIQVSLIPLQRNDKE